MRLTNERPTAENCTKYYCTVSCIFSFQIVRFSDVIHIVPCTARINFKSNKKRTRNDDIFFFKKKLTGESFFFAVIYRDLHRYFFIRCSMKLEKELNMIVNSYCKLKWPELFCHPCVRHGKVIIIVHRQISVCKGKMLRWNLGKLASITYTNELLWRANLLYWFTHFFLIRYS